MLSRVVCLAVWIALMAPVPVRAAECLPATPSSRDGNYIVPGAKGGIVYRRVGGRALKLDAWTPAGGAPRPAVVVAHGGGLTSGSRVAFVGQLLEMLTDAGYAWASVDYRLIASVGSETGDRTPRNTGRPSNESSSGRLLGFDAAVDDLVEAIAFVRCRSVELNVDARRVVLIGEDTGADLVAAALERGAPAVAAVLIGGRYEPRAAPSQDVARRPLLVAHGSADTEVPAARAAAFCEAHRAGGGRCDLLSVEGASHRPENWWPSQWGYKRDAVRFLCGVAPVPECGPGDGGTSPVAPRSSQASATLRPGLHSRLPFASGLTMNAWLPAPGAGRVPAVILVHGGGWEAGDRVTYITPLFEPLARAGFAWFSIDYRLTPGVRHDAQLEDVREAIAHVRANAARYGVDRDRIALAGESASGQMVTLLATERDLRLSAVVSFYGVYDFLPMVADASPRSLLVRLFGPRELDDEARALLRRYSPLHRAHASMPPVLLIHGTNERLWEQGLSMAERLTTLGVSHALVRLDGAPHGMENWEGRPEWLVYKARLVEWLRARFGS